MDLLHCSYPLDIRDCCLQILCGFTCFMCICPGFTGLSPPSLFMWFLEQCYLMSIPREAVRLRKYVSVESRKLSWANSMWKGAQRLQIWPRLAVHLAPAHSIQQWSPEINVPHKKRKKKKAVDSSPMNMIATVLRIVCVSRGNKEYFSFLPSILMRSDLKQIVDDIEMHLLVGIFQSLW